MITIETPLRKNQDPKAKRLEYSFIDRPMDDYCLLFSSTSLESLHRNERRDLQYFFSRFHSSVQEDHPLKVFGCRLDHADFARHLI